MRKKHMYKVKIRSELAGVVVDSLLYCSSKKVLENELKERMAEGYTQIGEITKSRKFCTDGNTEIWQTVLGC